MFGGGDLCGILSGCTLGVLTPKNDFTQTLLEELSSTYAESKAFVEHTLSETVRAGKSRFSFERVIFTRGARRDAREVFQFFVLLLIVLVSSGIIGVAGWVFLQSLAYVTRVHGENSWLIYLLPFAGVLTVYAYERWGKNASRGNNLIIESALTGARVPRRMVPFIFLATMATHLTGGSAGKEGAAVQIGGSIASSLGDMFHLDAYRRHTLVLTGISASFGSVFGTPLAGAFFGMEMCFIGKLDYRAVMYCLVASFSANAVTQYLGFDHSFGVISSVPGFDWYTFMVVGASAVVFGLVARLFSWSIRAVRKGLLHLCHTPLLAAAVGTAFTAFLFYAFNIGSYSGLSEWMIQSGFQGDSSLADVVIKLCMTALTLGSGCQGGEITPLFDMGASLGGWIGQMTGVEISFMAALGLVAVFGSATNTPLTTIMLAFDMFGPSASFWFVIVAFISYIVAGHSGIFTSQRIVTPKREGLSSDTALTIEEAMRRHDEEHIEEVEEAEEAEKPRM